jgi:hypothetical protein
MKAIRLHARGGPDFGFIANAVLTTDDAVRAMR